MADWREAPAAIIGRKRAHNRMSLSTQAGQPHTLKGRIVNRPLRPYARRAALTNHSLIIHLYHHLQSIRYAPFQHVALSSHANRAAILLLPCIKTACQKST